MNKGLIGTGTVAAAVAAVFALSSAPMAAAADPYLVGTWSGPRERISNIDDYRQGTTTLVFTEQIGRTFKGFVAYNTPQGDRQEDLVGAFSPDGTIVQGSDADGMYSFKLIDPVTLDYCYSQSGEGEFLTGCARLLKQP